MYNTQYTDDAMASLHEYLKRHLDYRVWKWEVKPNEGRQNGWLEVEYLLSDWEQPPLGELLDTQATVYFMAMDCDCCCTVTEGHEFGFNGAGRFGFSFQIAW